MMAQVSCVCLLTGIGGHQLPPLLSTRFPAQWSHGEAAWQGSWGPGGPCCPWGEVGTPGSEGAGGRSLCLGVKPPEEGIFNPVALSGGPEKAWSLPLAEQLCGCEQVTQPL